MVDKQEVLHHERAWLIILFVVVMVGYRREAREGEARHLKGDESLSATAISVLLSAENEVGNSGMEPC